MHSANIVRVICPLYLWLLYTLQLYFQNHFSFMDWSIVVVCRRHKSSRLDGANYHIYSLRLWMHQWVAGSRINLSRRSSENCMGLVVLCPIIVYATTAATQISHSAGCPFKFACIRIYNRCCTQQSNRSERVRHINVAHGTSHINWSTTCTLSYYLCDHERVHLNN